MAPKIILGIRLNDRNLCAPSLQEILTRHGCSIKTRIGLHDVSDNQCSPSGTILLELFGAEAALQALEDELRACPGLDLQKMTFAR